MLLDVIVMYKVCAVKLWIYSSKTKGVAVLQLGCSRSRSRSMLLPVLVASSHLTFNHNV